MRIIMSEWFRRFMRRLRGIRRRVSVSHPLPLEPQTAILITYEDLVSQRGRTIRRIERGQSIASIVQEAMPGELRVGALYNGTVIARSQWKGTTVRGGEELVLAPGVGEPATAIAIFVAIATNIVSMALQPRIKIPDAQNEERRFGFTRFSRDAIAGRPVQVCLGTRTKEGGRVVSSIPIEGPDSKSRLRLLICLGHGELGWIGNQTADFDDLAPGVVGFDGLEINDQTASNFESVRVWGRMGTAGQAVIPGFADTETISLINQALLNTDGVERVGANPSTEVISHTTSGGVNAVRLRIRFPGGLFVVGSRPGQRTVKARSRTRLVGDVWGAWSEHTFVEKTQSPFTAAVRRDGFVVADGAIEIQVERVSVESGSLSIVDDMDFDSVVEVVYSANTYVYPEGGGGYAMLAIELVANEQLSSQPTISVNVGGVRARVRKIGSAWDDPDPWEALPAYTDNPAALALLVAENKKWALSHQIGFARVNMESLWEFWDSCDLQVETFTGSGVNRTKFRLHATIDEAVDGWDLIRAICQVGRATPVVVGGVLRFVLEQAQPLPVEVFSAGSIVGPDESGEGGPQWSKQSSTGGFVRANQVVGLFEFADEDGEQEPLYFPGYGDKWLGTPLNEPPNPKKLDLFGVTDPLQAMSELVFHMNKIRNLGSTITFDTTRAFVRVQPMERFDAAIPRFGFVKQSGRLRLGSTAALLLLDEPLDIAGNTYDIVVLSADGTLETRQLVTATPDSAGTTLTVDADLTSVPGAYAEYHVVVQGSQPRPFICTSVELVDAARTLWRVSGVEYVSGVYNDTPENDVVRPSYPGRTGPGSVPGPVIDLTATLTQSDPPRARLAWNQTPTDASITARFTVYRRVLGEALFLAEPTQVVTTNAVLVDLEPGVVEEFAVVAVGNENRQISPNAATTVISPLSTGGEGVVTPDFGGDLPAPTGLSATPVPDGTFIVQWDQMAGAAQYRIELADPGDDPIVNGVHASSVFIQSIPDGPAPAALIHLAVGKTRSIIVRSETPEGRVSINSASIDKTGLMPAGEQDKLVNGVPINHTYTSTLPWNANPNSLLLNLQINAQNELEAIDPSQACRWESAEQATQNPFGHTIRVRWTMAIRLSPTLATSRTSPLRVPDPESFVWRMSSDPLCPTILAMFPVPESLLGLRVFVRTILAGVWSAWVDVTDSNESLDVNDAFQFRVTWQRTRIPYQLVLTEFSYRATEPI